MCGEKMSNFSRCSFIMGSPPHVRGKGCASSRRACTARITPAYAGKRACCWGHPAAWGDHPRTCGEKRVAVARPAAAPGSPPHMRGKVSQFVDLFRGDGITPAHAGKRRKEPMVAVSQLNHPRMCGEKWMYPCSQIRSLGSPPRMRGKETGSGIKTQKTRITPAYAGKSKRIAPSSVLFGDHPRVCGEKESARPARHAAWGSPPRMRGKEVGKHVLLCSGRITPAYAGKSMTGAGIAHNAWDHPRVCGEKRNTRFLALR